jgi:hypothetical protein
MNYAKYFLVSMILFCFLSPTKAQYKRRGETLQTNNGTTAKKTAKKKADYTVSQFLGKWQEFERKDRTTNEAIAFNDSIQIIFSDSNKVRTRTSVVTSMTMVGEADIDADNTLTVAADEYTIKSFADNILTLDDNDKFIHRLKKVDMFWYETLGKVSAKQNDYSNPIKISVSNILGKWSVYRRQAKPGATSDNALLIKNLNILNKTGANTASGDVTFYQNQTIQQLPCTITVTDTNIKIISSNGSWDLSVYQADANNFVFGSSELMYFSKK